MAGRTAGAAGVQAAYDLSHGMLAWRHAERPPAAVSDVLALPVRSGGAAVAAVAAAAPEPLCPAVIFLSAQAPGRRSARPRTRPAAPSTTPEQPRRHAAGRRPGVMLGGHGRHP